MRTFRVSRFSTLRAPSSCLLSVLGGVVLLSAITPIARAQTAAPIVTEDGAILLKGCGRECTAYNVDGSLAPTGSGGVASPLGTTYSVQHRLGAMISGVPTCVGNSSNSGDNIVTFDGIAETISPQLLGGAVPVVNELHEFQPDGTRYVRISTSSQAGDDLFPAGAVFMGTQLHDACFTVGLDDPLDWEGLDMVNLATITFSKDGTPLVGPVDVTSLFPNPWDGTINIILQNAAGTGIDAVQLDINVTKDVPVPNDDCINRLPVTDGAYAFDTSGATTDGVPHPQQCSLGSGYPDLQGDIWYAYTATCTGELTVDLCGSSFDTKVAVYNGCGRCPPSADPIACSDDFCFLQSYLPDPLGGSVPVTLGSCYTIRVGGYQFSQGAGVMKLQCNVVPPMGACCAGGVCNSPRQEGECLAQGGTWYEGESCGTFQCPIITPSHDECDHCIALQTGVPFIGSTVNATGDDISTCTINDFNDVWHCWTADCSGVVTFETCSGPDPNFDTSLAIYDSCEGQEIGCADDGCLVQTRLPNVVVTQGETYYIRVAGYNGTTGQYRILINPCRSACCEPNGHCATATHDQCLNGGGIPQIPGTLCLGDLDQNQIDDACDLCPGPSDGGPTVLSGSDPPNNAIDARQPHPPDSAATRQGFGSLSSPIRISTVPPLADLENCFAMCETDDDPVFGSNSISSSTYVPAAPGVPAHYRFILNEPISAGAVTTIQYVANPPLFISLVNHPGNVDGNSITNKDDVLKLLACCLGQGTCSPTLPSLQVAYRCDIDRSGANTPLDLLRLMDLLVGSEDYLPWNNTLKPSATGVCP